MKLHRLIKENIDVNRVDLKLLNYLNKNSISKNSTDIYKTLNKELHIDDKDVISRVIKLYKNNPIGDDEMYDESINWVVPSENDYSDEVRAIAQSLNVDPELFVYRGSNYDLEIYNYIPNNNLYEVGSYNDLVRSIREKMFQTEFSGYSIWMLETYMKLNEEILDYNITEIIEEEITNMSPYKMLNYIDDGNTIEDIEYNKEALEENEVELKISNRNKNSILKKIDKLESEKVIILQQIDDEDDSDEYTKYLDNLETKISELSEEYNNLLMHISSLEDEIEDLKEKTPSKEDIIKMYSEFRYEEIYEDFTNNPYDYISASELTIDEAIEENVIEFDEMGMVKEMISHAMKSDNLKIENINNQSYFIVIGFNTIF
jgi:hypothetical protein